MNKVDVLIIGAGASGLFCAIQAGKRGKTVAILDNGKKIGRKILMSGGGFCNFTNLDVSAENYLSQNPHFVKSALAQFSQWDFIALVAEYGIAYHEKELGQLFCDNSAQDIVNLLENLCEKNNVGIHLRQDISEVIAIDEGDFRFMVVSSGKQWLCRHLVIATGGLSMPALGATPFGYKVAEQFGLNIIPPRASLVPFTYRETEKFYTALSGVSLPVVVQAENGKTFSNQLLFTHRGLSGPAILQISNYWQPNQTLEIDLLPNDELSEVLKQAKQQSPKLQLKTLLARYLPKKWVEVAIEQGLVIDETLANLSNQKIQQLDQLIHYWQFQPNSTEGYRTAEVTLGGVDTQQISSKTMEAKTQKGLYFIGEVLDVTGQLGGYNFQWAWSSGFACGNNLN